MDTDDKIKLCTVLEVRYKGNIIFEMQRDGIINDIDLVMETDIRQLPICKKCKSGAVYHKKPEKGICKRCYDNHVADINAATDEMFAIGYW